MNKLLYVRFFLRKDAQVPVNSEKIGKDDMKVDDYKLLWADSVIEWMEKHPDGKVDFVWL